MKNYLINNNSDTLILFFSGWGCDEFEFEQLKSSFDVLILFDYADLDLNFDFSKYKEINLMAYSAGVFIASIFNFDFKINKKIAISGNPYLFDNKFGLSDRMQKALYNITEETADDFAKNYLIKTNEELKLFHHSKRTIDSCKAEFNSLKSIYNTYKQNIKDIYDMALFGDNERIFNLSVQKEFFKERLHLINNARHNFFFRIKSFEQFFDVNTIN